MVDPFSKQDLCEEKQTERHQSGISCVNARKYTNRQWPESEMIIKECIGNETFPLQFWPLKRGQEREMDVFVMFSEYVHTPYPVGAPAHCLCFCLCWGFTAH